MVIETGDIVEIRLLYQVADANAMNVFHYRCVENLLPAQENLEEFMGLFDVLVAAPIADIQGVNVTRRRLAGQVVFPIRFVAEFLDCSDPTGTDPLNALSSGTAAVFRRTGLVANPHNHGRVYVGGVAIDQLLVGNNNYLNTTAPLPFENIADAIGLDINIVAGPQMRPVIYNSLTPNDSVLVESTSYDPEVRYQRRREPSVGF